MILKETDRPNQAMKRIAVAVKARFRLITDPSSLLHSLSAAIRLSHFR